MFSLLELSLTAMHRKGHGCLHHYGGYHEMYQKASEGKFCRIMAWAFFRNKTRDRDFEPFRS